MKINKVSYLAALFLAGALMLPAGASTVNDIVPYYSPLDRVSITYWVDQISGNLTLRVTGTRKDISVRLYKDSIEDLHHIYAEESVSLPLTMGNGMYNMEVRLYITPTEIEHLWSGTFRLEMDNMLAPYLSSSRIVNWTTDMELTQKASALAEGKNRTQTALAISRFLADNFTYSHATPPPTYLPELNQIYQKKSGICYDFAALYAAMCRAVNIPCRLVMGYSEYVEMDKYHAWCQVYLDGVWVNIDPTYSIMGQKIEFLSDSKVTPLKYY